jgi:hypothetical protein
MTKMNETKGISGTPRARTNAHERPRKVNWLTEEHTEFICNDIAAWRGVKLSSIVMASMQEFQTYPTGMSEEARKHWWVKRVSAAFPRDQYGTPTAKCKYYTKIMEMRKAIEDFPRKHVACANKTIRIMRLEEMYKLCMEPQKETRIEFYKAKDGLMAQRKVETIRGPNIEQAREILAQIAKEMGDDVSYPCTPDMPISATRAIVDVADEKRDKFEVHLPKPKQPKT